MSRDVGIRVNSPGVRIDFHLSSFGPELRSAFGSTRLELAN
jgi:hypothetical protein